MDLFLGKEPGAFDVIIINDNLDDAYAKLKDALKEVSYNFTTHTLFIFLFFAICQFKVWQLKF